MAMLNNQMVIINLMFDWFCPCPVDLTILRDFCRCETWFGWFTSPCLVQNAANNDDSLAETCSNASCKIGWLWVLSTISLLAHWQPPFFHPCFMCMYLLWMINGLITRVGCSLAISGECPKCCGWSWLVTTPHVGIGYWFVFDSIPMLSMYCWSFFINFPLTSPSSPWNAWFISSLGPENRLPQTPVVSNHSNAGLTHFTRWISVQLISCFQAHLWSCFLMFKTS